MSKTPRTDAVWERFRTDLSLEPDVEFSTLARELECELQEAKDRIEQLEEWKQSALAVEREWDANSIATMLGGNLGESQRKVIQREVPKLLNRIKQLEEDLGDAYAEMRKQYPAITAVFDRSVWTKAKEDKL